MRSSAISASSRSIDAVAASNSVRARASPYRDRRVATSSFSPVNTWPPLRELAPQPTRSRSRTSTDAPARAMPRRGQTWVAGADDRDVNARGKLEWGGSFERAGRNRVPPVGIVLHRWRTDRESRITSPIANRQSPLSELLLQPDLVAHRD